MPLTAQTRSLASDDREVPPPCGALDGRRDRSLGIHGTLAETLQGWREVTGQRPPSNRGGRGLCAACAHPSQPVINSELAAGTSFRSLSARFNISRPALKAHKTNHLSPALIAVHRSGGAGDVLEQLRDLVSRARRWLDSAEQMGNSAQGLAAIREARETLALVARGTGELEPDRNATAVDLIHSAEWMEARDMILDVLSQFPEAKQAMIERLRVLNRSENGKAPSQARVGR